ncbi:hypothetical protein C2G38_2224865 [Gigaspora rosea]|uniref:Uncharacterized protein n=1 Tax=Gigaspora rosea TaxID=44941 RepID=A0A397U1H4_9GLOM|nr:hypothetical protein C2G38_2224865 [Gigaspora rosea]
MRYSKGPNKGKIILLYFQQKAYNYFSQSFYKHKSDYYSLQSSNLKLEKKNKKLDQKNNELIKQTQSLGAKTHYLKKQKSWHISEIRFLVRQSKQITNDEFRKKVKSIFKTDKKREPPQNCLATSTLCIWHQDVSELQFNKQIYQIKDEEQLPSVIVAQLQHIVKCNADTMSNIVIKHIQECDLNVKNCIIWITNNTSYMSGDKKGAVVLFNKKTKGNSLRIGCGFHIIQIIINQFEQKAFDLYSGLMGFHYNQYQLPLRTRWGYELRMAKQYLNRYTAHLEFATWFIDEMKNHNAPKQYNNKLSNLPPGRRAHKMPDKVYEWHRFLQNIVKNFEINSGRSFASSFYHGVLKKPWIKPPNDLEIRFSKELEKDLRNGKTDSLGLYELLLQNDNFFQEFEQFYLNDELMIYNLPELYQFIKN